MPVGKPGAGGRAPERRGGDTEVSGSDGGRWWLQGGSDEGGGGGPLGWQHGSIQGHQGPVAAPRPHAATSSVAPAMTRAAACVEGGDMR
jgi:hypothetical protein